MVTNGVTIVQAGDRIDTLAMRIYGDPGKYTFLIAANPELDIWAPQPGLTIFVPKDGNAA